MADDESDVRSLEELWQQLGIPRDLLWAPDTLLLVTSCAMELFCDEISLPHPGAAGDARLRALFGYRSFEEGSFRRALQRVLAENSPAMQPALQAFRLLMARTLAAATVRGSMSHVLPSTNLVNDTLMFDGNQHSYELPPSSHPRVVVDYGPGLNERFIVAEHDRAVTAGRPFFYLPVTQGPFVNDFAMACLALARGTAAVDQYVAQGFYLRQEDGILAATSRLLASPLRAQCDVIFCSGLQLVDRRELEAGIVNAFTLLRPGGMLLIRSLKERNPPHAATTYDMLATAHAAGFADPSYFHSIATPRMGESFPTLTAILTKR